jgi:hypothetical protein
VNFAVFRPIGGRTATVADIGSHHDVFLFDRLPGGQWTLAVLVLAGWFVLHRVLKQRRRREQLRRRREIRARLYAAAPATFRAPGDVREIDLTEAGIVIDLRDGAVYGSEITLESGDTVETGIVGPFPAD